MKLYLSGCGFGEQISIVKTIKSTDEASALTRKFIEKYDLGGSTFDYGFITDDNKNLLYVVEYNGVILTPKDHFGESHDKVSLESDIGKIAVKEFNLKI